MTDKPALVLEQLSFAVEKGTVTLDAPCTLTAGHLYLIEGASGVGKSSLARVLLGLGACVAPPLQASARVHLEGVAGDRVPVWDERGFHARARDHLGFMPQLNALAFIDDLGPAANLTLFSALPRAEARAGVEALARRFAVWPLPGSLSRASGGERMRLSSVRALLPRRRGQAGAAVLIADEPTVGLDRDVAVEVAACLIEEARGGERIVCVISHDPSLLLGAAASARAPVPPGCIRISRVESGAAQVIGWLRHHPPARAARAARWRQRTAAFCDVIGGAVLAPLAFVHGLLRMDRTSLRAGVPAVLRTALNPGTWVFVAAAAVVIGVTLAFFAFAKMPKREILEPLFLPEFLREFGLAMLLVLPPLFAGLFATAKTGAAQAARLAAAVRSGLHDTLALARILPESYALVPAVLGQVLGLYVATALAMVLALGSSALVFQASGSALSLDLALHMMLASLDRAEGWPWWLLAKTTASGAAAGALAALFGLRPTRGSESDVARAVHRTLLWTLLAVLAIQCAFVVWQFG